MGFTDHAIDRFVERAGVAGPQAVCRQELSTLCASAGVVQQQRPEWSGLLDDAPAYLVVLDWLCCPLRPGLHGATWDATTLVCRSDATWWEAYRAGWIPALPNGLQLWPEPDEFEAWQAERRAQEKAELAKRRRQRAAELRPFALAAVVLGTLALAFAGLGLDSLVAESLRDDPDVTEPKAAHAIVSVFIAAVSAVGGALIALLLRDRRLVAALSAAVIGAGVCVACIVLFPSISEAQAVAGLLLGILGWSAALATALAVRVGNAPGAYIGTGATVCFALASALV